MTAPMVAATPRSVDDLRGRRTVVLGLARSGLALARMLARAGARVTVYDRRGPDDLSDAVEALRDTPVELALAAPPDAVASLLVGADLIFTSPSVSAHFATTDEWLRQALAAAEASGTPVLSEVELFLRLTRARVVAVTGTKGKTTTAALIGAILESAEIPHVVGGNIGAPLVEQVESLTERHWAVLELSELQLPTISRGADVAVYTNILEDHLDRHGSVEAYRAVKARLAELAPAHGRVVLNADDDASLDLAMRLAARTNIHLYGLDPPPRTPGVAAWVGDGWLILGDVRRPDATERVIPAADVPLPGAHMLRDVLAASLAARLIGAEPSAIATAIRGFPGVPHRLEPVADVAGVRYINDSQATIPVAAIAALRAYDAPIVVIAGGRGKGLDYAGLGDAIADRCRAAVVMGETAPDIAAAIGGRVPVERASTMDEAVVAAQRMARPGDVVLLAPAAASFDAYVDYAARGDAFRGAVERLATQR
ncbi:MAG: UDP-N-acetylmuramoyl-L-alanine--D-glutamate ligase [Candidatus Limnocylindria bacterium]